MDNTYRLEYGARGEERKRLVKAVAEYRETFSEYCGAPTFAYTVDEITIDREGTLIFPRQPDEEDLQGLTEFLGSKGYIIGERQTEPEASGDASGPEGTADTAEETVIAETEDSGIEEKSPETAGTEGDILTIEVPKDGFSETALENLRKMVAAKESLLKKSLGTDDLSIEVAEDRIRFPWFHETDSISVSAYTKLVTALCKAAKEAKRVTATDREVESEKYAFRTWLLRLGFIGTEYKHDRAVLMKNLSGTAAFRNAADAQAFADRQKEKRDAAKSAMEENNGDAGNS